MNENIENINIDKNKEIADALLDFEVKSNEEVRQKVQVASKDPEVPKMIQFVVKHSGGQIKDQRQAEYVLLVLVVLMIVVSIYLLWGGKSSAPEIPSSVLEQMKQIPISH